MTEQNSSLKPRLSVSATALLALALLLPMFAFAGAAPQRAEAASASTLAQYKTWIAQARAMYPYPQSTDKMYRVMMCESGGNASVVGGTGNRYIGLFQYAPSTWAGRWNSYRYNSMYDAKSQIFATAKAWSIGMQNQWSCYFITAGR